MIFELSSAEIAVRNGFIIAMLHQREGRDFVASCFGLSPIYVSAMPSKCKMLLPKVECNWRQLRGSNAGRPKVWPDCPTHLQFDYMNLRRSGFKAAEARAMLEEAA